VAARLTAAVRDGDLVARLGGDEFAVLTKGSPERSEALAEQLVEALRPPFTIDGVAVSIGVSVGVAIMPDDGITSDQLLVAADNALYAAKRAGKNTWRRAAPLHSDLDRDENGDGLPWNGLLRRLAQSRP